ncbi:MAG: hypothetical protein RL885_27475 [Planctomycetota bacterium]
MKLLLALCACALLALPLAAQPITPIQVINDTDLERDREVVSFGIPFAEGTLRLQDLPYLYVTDPSGREVASQYRALARWTPGNSLRWVLVTFPATVAENSSAQYYLRRSDTRREYSGRTAGHDMSMVRNLFRPGLFEGVVTDHFGTQYYTVNPKISLVEAGPLKTIVRVDSRHRAHPGEGIKRDFLWSTAYVTFLHDGIEPQRFVKIDWYLKNSYTLRPIGNTRFKSFFVHVKHNGRNPYAMLGSPLEAHDDLPASDGRYGALEQPLLFGWGGDANRNIGFYIKKAWQTFPKSIGVDGGWTRAWLFPEGDYTLGDGAHVGASMTLTWNQPAEQAYEVAATHDRPLLYKLNTDYLRGTRAWGDFGSITSVPAGTWLDDMAYSSYNYGWQEFGETFHSTHTTGSPRNRYSYLLPYMQTGERRHYDWVEDQLYVSMNLRPYHWNTYEKSFDFDEFRQDSLWDGQWSWRWPGAGYQARQNIPASYAPWRSEWGGPWNGWDFEHMTIDDLRDYYFVTGHPKALEAMQEVGQGLRSYKMSWDRGYKVHSARVLGWCLRTFLDLYRITANEEYWNAATNMVQLVLERDGQRYHLINGFEEGWEPFVLQGKVHRGQSNYDHFKPWMSAVGGIGLIHYYELLTSRADAGKSDPVDPSQVLTYIRDTAELIIDMGWRENQGFIYELDIYDVSQNDELPASASGTAEWNVEFLALASRLLGDASLFEPGRWVMNVQMSRDDLRGDPWYQAALEIAGQSGGN